MNSSNWFGILCALLGLWLVMLPIEPERVVIKRVENPYRVAESISCTEVSRVCAAHKRQEKVTQWTINRLGPTSKN